MKWDEDVRVWVPSDGSDPTGLRLSSLGYQDYVPGVGLLTLAVVLVCLPTRAFAVGLFYIICSRDEYLTDLEAYDGCVLGQIIVVVGLCVVVLLMLIGFGPMVNRDSQRAAIVCGVLNVAALLSIALAPLARGTPNAELPALVAVVCFIAAIVVLVIFEIKKVVAPFKPPEQPIDDSGGEEGPSARCAVDSAVGAREGELVKGNQIAPEQLASVSVESDDPGTLILHDSNEEEPGTRMGGVGGEEEVAGEEEAPDLEAAQGNETGAADELPVEPEEASVEV